MSGVGLLGHTTIPGSCKEMCSGALLNSVGQQHAQTREQVSTGVIIARFRLLSREGVVQTWLTILWAARYRTVRRRGPILNYTYLKRDCPFTEEGTGPEANAPLQAILRTKDALIADDRAFSDDTIGTDGTVPSDDAVAEGDPIIKPTTFPEDATLQGTVSSDLAAWAQHRWPDDTGATSYCGSCPQYDWPNDLR